MNYVLFVENSQPTGERAAWLSTVNAGLMDEVGLDHARWQEEAYFPGSSSRQALVELHPGSHAAALFGRVLVGKPVVVSGSFGDGSLDLSLDDQDWNRLKNLEIRLDDDLIGTLGAVRLHGWVDVRLKIGDGLSSSPSSAASSIEVDIENIKRGQLDATGADVGLQVTTTLWSNEGSWSNAFHGWLGSHADIVQLGGGTNETRPAGASAADYDGHWSRTSWDLGAGDDRLAAAQDFLSRDQVWGGAGNDTIDGGGGDDILNGDGSDPTAPTTIAVEIDLLSRSAGYANSFGWYDATTGKGQLLDGRIIADRKLATVDERFEITLDAATDLQFFLIPNGYNKNSQPWAPLHGDPRAPLDVQVVEKHGQWTVQTADGAHTFAGQMSPAFFSEVDKNSDGLDHVRRVGDQYRWEDLRGLGDRDFNDAIFSVDLEAYTRAGDDVLSGGSGADLFVFELGWGHDVVTDFSPWASSDGDRIVLPGVVDIATLVADAMQVGDDTLLQFAEATITLRQVQAQKLSVEMFISS